VHLVSLAKNEEEAKACDKVYADLQAAGVTVLYDDRPDARAGEKLADAELLGMPHRILVSAKTLAEGKVEYKGRRDETAQLLSLPEVLSLMS
jgi:prolyl-tRNA synthetase